MKIDRSWRELSFVFTAFAAIFICATFRRPSAARCDAAPPPPWLSFNMKNCGKYLRSVAEEAKANVKSGARSNCVNLSVLLRATASDADGRDVREWMVAGGLWEWQY